ncbi:MAG TPA: alpha/beta hydrolase [Sandaracinaceae bacterium LLY-WYZ-13_1]|nr:alpha/beta hydrolase [Sandaracinaceae bacterium LLY-WYZ-13_1]
MDRRRLLRRARLWALAAALILGAVLGFTQLQRAMLFPRGHTRPDPSALSTPGLERWWLDSPDGRVEAWFLPGEGVDADHPGPAVVFTHGNAELIDHWPEMLAPYRALGVSVVLPEYRGYGRSAGSPSEAAIATDLRALHARLSAHPAVDATRLVYHGRSLGGGAVGTLLDDHPPRALILESAFTSVPDVAASMLVPGFLIADRFELLDALRGYEGPALLFHGVADRVIPVEHARRLAAAKPDAELVLYDCGHNDLPPPDADYWPRITRFLRRHDVLDAP